jgi:hypothetical protein
MAESSTDVRSLNAERHGVGCLYGGGRTRFQHARDMRDGESHDVPVGLSLGGAAQGRLRRVRVG